MYAIVETGGKQYRVEPGQTVRVERLDLEEGAEVTLDKVLLVCTEGQVRVGAPYVEGVTVSAKVLAQGRDKKVLVFHYKNKTNIRRMRGHRQYFTDLQVEGIEA